ncbi:branched-chain amino acid ABC transporter permease [Poseidonibacter ostreae]|jgi:branched-chain amino acid transport system permease protein|uniref:Branched-chain amino acid ABC transporter permease n=1 Tax=Poseidonibacter ostreae TaxID=2654171 RepID=A0A6L4WNF8_9BACT|nr:branched-chain amino acid ABC transporter permease [Poseidonibacter ostreae]KAB7882972.1 branched-chain amino acid ABC transporter permease [Poseidonibacter ostreae]KAB7884712.1 branched-chain amino acid ABC transporter permease [Poseidonibacter ostreae]KAB7887205.1 branched-chain amino acid ABC transporter permease [Poseidonibacter ostreae]
MLEDKIFTNQRLINLAIIVTAIWFTWFAQNTFDEYTIRIINNVAIFIILAVSYNLINGITGQFSLEPNGFVAIGAYVTAILIVDADTMLYQYDIEDPSAWVLAMQAEFAWALLFAGIISALVALSLSFPVFRVRGDYLAIVTLGFGFIIKILAINNPQITNGSLGINDIPEYSNLYWTGGIAIFTVLAILNIIYSKYGRAMKAVRDDEDAATAMGVNTFKIKTYAFTTSAFFEGVGGGLLASLLTSISPDLFTFFLTFQLLIIIVLGGLGSTTGAILGTIFVMAGLEYMRFLDEPMSFMGIETDGTPGMRMVVFSLILILVMLFAREGLVGKKELKDFFKKKKAGK